MAKTSLGDTVIVPCPHCKVRHKASTKDSLYTPLKHRGSNSTSDILSNRYAQAFLCDKTNKEFIVFFKLLFTEHD